MSTDETKAAMAHLEKAEQAQQEHADPAADADAEPGVKGVEAVMESAMVTLTKYQAIRKFWRPVLVCCLAAVGALSDGFQWSLPGGIVSNAGFIKQMGTVHNAATGAVSLDPRHIAAWSGGTSTLQFLGAHAAGALADRTGRRVAFWVMTVCFWCGTITEGVADNWKVWLVGKMLMGLATGMLQSVCITYMSEMAPAQIRGTLISLYALFYAFGQLTAAISLQVVNVTNKYAWRRAVYSEWALHGCWLLALLLLPESPWYYARKGRAEDAKRVLTRLYGAVEGYDVEYEYLAMAGEIEREQLARAEAAEVPYAEIFKGSNFKRLVASTIGITSQSWAGAQVTFTYSVYFFQQAGIKQPFQANLIVYCILIFAVVLSFWTIEVFGRRTLILTGGCGLTLFNLLIGILGLLKQTNAVLNALLALVAIWVFIYASTFASVGWALAGEVATPRLRSKTTSTAVGFNILLIVCFATSVPFMLASSGPGARNWGVKTLFLFAITICLSTVAAYFYVPETKGRTFNELDEMYEAKIAPRKMKAYKTQVEQLGLKPHRAL